VGAMLVMADPAVLCADHIAGASDRRARPQDLKPKWLNSLDSNIGCDFCVRRSAHASLRMLPGESPDHRRGLLRSLSIT
jgi:hypothetical protein